MDAIYDGAGMPPARSTCYRCFRPSALCACRHACAIDNRHRVIVLQHPRERLHPFGTVRFVTLGLTNSEVHVARGADGVGLAEPLDLPPDTGLLYPSPDARVLEEVERADLPRALLLLDGTWSHANRLYRQEVRRSALESIA